MGGAIGEWSNEAPRAEYAIGPPGWRPYFQKGIPSTIDPEPDDKSLAPPRKGAPQGPTSQ